MYILVGVARIAGLDMYVRLIHKKAYDEFRNYLIMNLDLNSIISCNLTPEITCSCPLKPD